MALRLFRGLVFLLGLAPFFWLAWLYRQDQLGIIPEETLLHLTGHIGLNLLLLTIVWGFARRFTGWIGFIATRRQLGLWACWWLIAHATLWLGWDQGWYWPGILQEVQDLTYLKLGLSALFILLLLAVTSPARIRLALPGPSWAILHRLIYLATALGIVHLWIITRLDYQLVTAYALLLAGLVILRLVFLRPPGKTPKRQNASSRQTS